MPTTITFVAPLTSTYSALLSAAPTTCAPTLTTALFAAVARYAARERLPIAVHVAESEAEERLVVAGEGEFADGFRRRGIAVAPRARSPIALLEHTGLLAARPLLIHAVRVDARDMALAARHGCGVAHCPTSNAKLGHGVAPLAGWLAAGVPVGLGSDSVASNNRMSLLEEARLAALLQGAQRGDPAIVDASAALRLATLGGAAALGLDGEIGSLEAGKQADLAAFPLDGAVAVPLHDPASAAVFALAGRPASFVAVAGVPRVRDGRLVEEPAGLVTRVHAAASLLRAWRVAPVARPEASIPAER
jgi:5-methylthioadenosine/S-adenosylhomocysteine deaminase